MNITNFKKAFVTNIYNALVLTGSYILNIINMDQFNEYIAKLNCSVDSSNHQNSY